MEDTPCPTMDAIPAPLPAVAAEEEEEEETDDDDAYDDEEEEVAEAEVGPVPLLFDRPASLVGWPSPMPSESP